jgi:hypothetical protein
MKKLSRINDEQLKDLEQYIGSKASPSHFFTMTEINKVGINPQSSYNTPLGIYAYPLTSEYYNKLIKGTLPFAGDKPYVNLFSLNVPVFNLDKYAKEDLIKDTKIIKELIISRKEKLTDRKRTPEDSADFEIQKAFEEARGQEAISKFWNLTRITAWDPKKWNTLLRTLGYTNFYDPGESIIHPSEPTQIVILDPRIISHTNTYFNPWVTSNALNKTDPSDKKILEQKINKRQELLSDKIAKVNNPKTLSKIVEFIFDNSSLDLLDHVMDNPNMNNDVVTLIIQKIVTNPLKNNPFLTNKVIKRLIYQNKISNDIAKALMMIDHQGIFLPQFVYSQSPNILMNLIEHPEVDINTLAKIICDFNHGSNIDQAAYEKINSFHKFQIELIIETCHNEKLLKMFLSHPDPKIREFAKANYRFNGFKDSELKDPKPPSSSNVNLENTASSKYNLISNSIFLFHLLTSK